MQHGTRWAAVGHFTHLHRASTAARSHPPPRRVLQRCLRLERWVQQRFAPCLHLPPVRALHGAEKCQEAQNDTCVHPVYFLVR